MDNDKHFDARNPCGLDGFAFLEFSSLEPDGLHKQFLQMGFQKTAIHQSQQIHHYQQGNIIFLVNESSDSQAFRHAQSHGAGACAMGFRVHDATQALEYALKHGASAFQDNSANPHNLPAIEAIGGSVIYFVDKRNQPFQNFWTKQACTSSQSDRGDCALLEIDHLTHNVHRGNLEHWTDFYKSIFNFQQIRFFDIEGQMSGLISRALGSPCGKIKIPLNESKDDISQIEEFLHAYQGEGIQHIALSTNRIYDSVAKLRQQGVNFLDVPDTYYEMIKARIPWQHEPLDLLRQERILIDGESTHEAGLLLQIFTENVFGPVFFEIIQRCGNEGFGEGNFQALFEAIEQDQIRRGTLVR